MLKYVEIYYDKFHKTQRFVIAGEDDCTAVINEKLKKMGIPFTHSKFIGRYFPLNNFKDLTYKYAKKWQWLYTIDLTTKGEF